MGQLDRISSPADVRRLTSQPGRRPRRRDPHLPGRPGLPHRRPPRPEPRRRRADDRDAPGLRVAAGHDGVRHGPPGLRAQAAHRPAATSRSCAARAGCPATRSRAESEHDVVENSHASTALCWADGIARANQLQRPRRPARRRRDRRRRPHRRHGLGGAQQHRRRPGPAGSSSSSTTTAAPTRRRSAASPHHLDTLRTTPRLRARPVDWGKRDAAHASGAPGRPAYDALHGVKKGLKDVVAPQGMFEDLGIKYIGPVDGHDLAAIEQRPAQRQGVRRPGHRARHHREGPRLRARPSRTWPTGSTPSA